MKPNPLVGLAPCKTCSRLYRANRVRCPVCGFWKRNG